MTRQGGRALWLVAALSAGVVQAEHEDSALAARVPLTSALDGPFPGRVRGMRLALEGQRWLEERKIGEALAALRRAVREDPVLDVAWSGLASAAIAECRRDEALFAAYQAAYLNPQATIPIDQLRAARALQCPPREPADVAEATEVRLARAIHDADLWRTAAEARTGSGEVLLSAFYLERALASGAEPAPLRAMLLERLQRAGLWRAALRLIDGWGTSAERPEELVARLAEISPHARALAETIGARVGADDADALSQLSECAEVVIANAPEAGETVWRDELLSLLRPALAARTAFDGGSIELDAAWSVMPNDTDAADPDQAGLLLLRRHPGDTQLSLFALREGGSETALDAALARALSAYGARRESEWARCRTGSGQSCRGSSWSLSTAAGTATVDLWVLARTESEAVVVGILLAGSGGYDAPGRAESRREASERFATLRVDAPEALMSAATDGAWVVPLPVGWRATDRPREAAEPWLSFPVGPGLRVDLPAGAVASRDTPEPEANCGLPADANLYWRATFVDRDGRLVRVGDATFWAWARQLESTAVAVSTPPSCDPQASYERAASLDDAFVAAGSAWRGSVARFRGRAWSGRWLIARVTLGTETVEIAQPVAIGEESLSLLWVPVTVRHDGDPGPPPLVENAGGQSVRVLNLGQKRSGSDPREGVLSGTDFQVAFPRGFRVSATPGSSDGLPLTLRHSDGSQIVIDRWTDPLARNSDWRPLAEKWIGRTLSSWRRWSRGRAELGLARAEDPLRRDALLLARAGDAVSSAALRIRFVPGAKAADDDWNVALALVADSLKFPRRNGATEGK